MIRGALVLHTVLAMALPVLVRTHALNAFTVMLFGLATWRLGLSPELPAVFAFIFGGVLLAVIDWKVKRLPTRLVHVTFAGVGAGLVLASIVEWDIVPLATAALGCLLFANAFFVLWYLTKRFSGMLLLGFGDVRLAAVLGLLLGWYGLEYVLYGALAGHALALVLAVAMSIGQRKLVLQYSFGPPLIAGALAVVLLHG